MKLTLTLAAVAALTSAPVFAEGDAAAGEKAFKQCVACHVVVNDAGETLAGRKAKVGPNLYGIMDRAAGSVEGFKYSKGMLAAGEAGTVWTEETFMAFVQDPTTYLREVTGDAKARSKMTYKVRKPDDAANLYAYLSSLSAE